MKFKLGDRVLTKSGKYVTILEVEQHPTMWPYYTGALAHGGAGWCSEEFLTLVSQAPQAQTAWALWDKENKCVDPVFLFRSRDEARDWLNGKSAVFKIIKVELKVIPGR
jgi:hypothetical protein